MDLPGGHALPEPPQGTDLNADFLVDLADDRGLFRFAVFDAATGKTIGQRRDHMPGAADHQHAAFPDDNRHRTAAAGSFGNLFHAENRSEQNRPKNPKRTTERATDRS